MERFKTLVREANQAFETADHLAFVTYPVVKETKLLAVVMDNLFKALSAGMSAILYYDYIYKRISQFPNEFSNRFDLFKMSCAKRYNFPREDILLIKELLELTQERKQAPMEFARRDKYVIASKNYRLKMLDIKKVKTSVNTGRAFLKKVNEVADASDRRFLK